MYTKFLVPSLFRTHLEVLGTDAPLGVLCLQMSKLSVQSWLVIEKRDADVNTTQDSLCMSAELGGELVLAVDCIEETSGVWVLLE